MGVASVPHMSCNRCSNKVLAELTSTACMERKSEQKALSDYSLNVPHVLGFLSVVDGGSETQRLLGFCDLPNNYAAMERSTFTQSEQTIHPVAMAMVEDVIWQNIIEEVSVSAEHDVEFNIENWKQAALEKDTSYLLAMFGKVQVSTDMGWQKRGFGFDSLSGHALCLVLVLGNPWCGS
jgi:hypothetical protein